MRPGTKGQDYASQCPVCDMELRWALLDSGRKRIERVRGQHENGCPAAVLDPRELRRMTMADVENELDERRRRATPPPGGGSP